jgi:transposase
MPKTIVGLDLGNRKCTFVVLSDKGTRLDQGEVLTRRDTVHSFFSQYKHARVVLEAGTDSGWISRIVESLGHEAIVAHPRSLQLISKSSKKSDKNDAQILAELGLMEGKLTTIARVKHRSAGAQADLVTLQARDALVEARTKLINFVRAMVKSCGERVTGCSSRSFADRAKEKIPEEIRLTLLPILETIRQFGVRIREYDRNIVALCEDKYPQTALLMQVQGVGHLTALAYVLVIDDPRRFRRSRDVGAYLGLVPQKDQSGQSDPQLGITKCGNGFLRRLLVGSAQYILGPFNTKDSDLKRYGEQICVRGGKNAKRRAVVAVARKLAVLLHQLWVSGETYEPLRNSEPKGGGRRKGKMVISTPAA